MDLAGKIAEADTYARLAKVLLGYFHDTLKVDAVAVRDALGLWHILPDNQVRLEVGDFHSQNRKARIAFKIPRKNSAKKALHRELKKQAPLIALRLHTIDLSERLKRFRILATSEDKYTRHQLQQAKQKARLEFEAKLNLFGRYSHDLKTPFSMLISNLESMILGDEAIPAKLRLRLETIRGVIYGVLRTAGQSLDAARIFTRKKQATLIPYNFSEFVREIVEVYAIVFESYGIDLKTDIEAGIPAEIDPIQMEKVLNNLLNNAIKHNIPGSLAHVSLKASRHKIELSIADTGLGFKQAEKIKDMNPWRFSSHGYGLEIVRELVRANRGRLSYRSEGGVGTTVTVTLPTAPGLKNVVGQLRRHNFQTTLHEVEYLAGERTRLSRRKRKTD